MIRLEPSIEYEYARAELVKLLSKKLETRSTKRVRRTLKKYKYYDFTYIIRFIQNVIGVDTKRLMYLADNSDQYFDCDKFDVELRELVADTLNKFSQDDMMLLAALLDFFAISKLIYGIEVDEGCQKQYITQTEAAQMLRVNKLPEASDIIGQNLLSWWD